METDIIIHNEHDFKREFKKVVKLNKEIQIILNDMTIFIADKYKFNFDKTRIKLWHKNVYIGDTWLKSICYMW
jgi:hypothetical protein